MLQLKFVLDLVTLTRINGSNKVVSKVIHYHYYNRAILGVAMVIFSFVFKLYIFMC